MSLGYMGENHGTCEETGKQHGRIFRYRGSGMYEKCGSELERPYPSPKGKKKAYKLVICQDLVQVKMRNFSHFNPLEAQPQCVFFYTIVRIHLVTYSYNGYEFVSYCRKLPDIRKSSGMPACNREF